ncbi:MAG: toast rack family protein [Anaerolineae bacterium]|jgi:hypothetical protein|nr:toast rack family protein [Anaerolineae bacterium]
MRRGQLFWGIILVLLGLSLLLGNIFEINVWDYLWPLILIGLGAAILWGTLRRRDNETFSETFVLPFEGAERARIKLQYGAGKLTVHGDPGAADLIAGNFSGGVEHTVRQENGVTQVTLRSPVQHAAIWPWDWADAGSHRKWSVGLSDRVPLDLEFETGACDAYLNLASLPVKSLRVQTGASSTMLRLPEHAGHTDVRLESGAASIEVRVPEGVAARIRLRGGLASNTVDTVRFPRAGDVYQSPDYETASNRADISVETGVASVDIR